MSGLAKHALNRGRAVRKPFKTRVGEKDIFPNPSNLIYLLGPCQVCKRPYPFNSQDLRACADKCTPGKCWEMFAMAGTSATPVVGTIPQVSKRLSHTTILDTTALCRRHPTRLLASFAPGSALKARTLARGNSAKAHSGPPGHRWLSGVQVTCPELRSFKVDPQTSSLTRARAKDATGPCLRVRYGAGGSVRAEEGPLSFAVGLLTTGLMKELAECKEQESQAVPLASSGPRTGCQVGGSCWLDWLCACSARGFC